MQSPRRGAAFDRLYGLYVDSGHADILLEKCLAETSRSISAVKDSKSFQLLGLLYERRGEIDRAIDAFERSAELDSKNALAPFYLAEQYAAKNRIADAVAALEESIRRKPGRVDLRIILQTLGRLSTRSGESDRSDSVWALLDRLYPDDPDLSVRIAEILESEGRLDDARRRYEQLLERPSTDDYARVRYTLAAADIKIRQENDPEALDDFERLLDRLAPDSWLADSVRARIERLFALRSNDSGLIDFYRKRLDKRPSDTETLRRLATIYLRLDRESEARNLLETGIEHYPADIPLRFSLIELFVRRQEISSALKQYREVARLAPDNVDYLTDWGRLILSDPDKSETERKAGAVEIWTRLCRTDPNDPIPCLRVADLALQYDIPDVAERFYRKAVELQPDSLAYREYLGLFYHRNFQRKKAVEMIRSMAETGNRSVESLLRSGTLFQSLGYAEEAYQTFREAVEAAPDDLSVRWKYLETLIRRDELAAVMEQLTAMERLVGGEEDFALFLRREVRFLRESQKLESATKILDDRLSRRTDADLRTLWRLAVYFQAVGRTDRAVETVDRILESGNATAPVLRFAVDLFDRTGRREKAMELCETLVEKDGVWRIEHLKRLANLQLEYDRIDRAVETGRKFMELGGGNAANGRFYAELLFRAGRRSEGIEALRQALRAEPGDATTMKLLAKQLAETGRNDEAVEIAWRLFDRTESVSEKLDAVATLAEYYEKQGRYENLLERFRVRGRTSEQRRESDICLARALSFAGKTEAARKTLENLSTSLEENGKDDMLLLEELVSVAEKQEDYAAAVRYQERFCRHSGKPADLDRLFILYDLNGDKEKAVELFLRQVLLKTDLKDRLDAIDRMIRRGEYDAVDRVLAFFEIHDAANWQLPFRRIALASYRNEEDVAGLVWDFRDLPFTDEKLPEAAAIDDARQLKEIRERFQSGPWRLPGALPTADWSESGIAIPAELLPLVRRQEGYLPTVFRDRLRRNEQYRTPNDVPAPKPFDDVRSFREARFLALCWLLKEAIDLDDFPAAVEELHREIPSDDPDRVRLDCLLYSIKKVGE